MVLITCYRSHSRLVLESLAGCPRVEIDKSGSFNVQIDGVLKPRLRPWLSWLLAVDMTQRKRMRYLPLSLSSAS